MEFESLGLTTLARIKKIIGAIELHKNGKDDEDVDVTMEFIVGSLFPELLTNFISALETLNIAIHDSEGNFRNTYEVLNEISNKWKEVDKNDENN